MKAKSISKTRFDLVYNYSGLYSFGNNHFSKGFKTLEEAHSYVIARGEDIADSGLACEFVVAKNKQSATADDKTIYRGRVLKTFIEYTLYNNKEEKMVINRKSNKKFNNTLNTNIMSVSNYFSETETKFLGLEVKVVKKIAAKCVNAVNANVGKGEDAVVKAVKKVSSGLIEVHLENKEGKQTEGHVCLQSWELYCKTHCGKFLDLPTGSKKYMRVNGTIKIQNLEEKILEVHTKGNALLNKIKASDTTKTTELFSVVSDVTEKDINAAESSVQSVEVLVDAKELVDIVARTIVAYHDISDNNLILMGAQSIGSQVEKNSHGLFSATIDSKKITVNSFNGQESNVISANTSVDDIYNRLLKSITDMLIRLTIVNNAKVASVVDVHSVEGLYKTAA